MLHRRLRAGCIAVAALAALVQIGCSASAPTASYYLSAPLVAADGGAASGRVEALLSILLRALYVEVAGLAPDSGYQVTLDGVAIASIVTDATGTGFVNHPVDERSSDPRGRSVAVVDENGVAVLVLAVGDPAHVEVEHAPLAAFAGGGGSTNLRSVGGERTLAVRLDGVDPGAYDLLIDGLLRAQIAAPEGRGMTLVDAADVASGSSVEVQLDGVGLYVNTPRARILGLDWCAEGASQQDLPGAPYYTSEDAQALATLTTAADCGHGFDVTIAGIPIGDYDLWVGGALRGEITVGMDETGASSGEISFSGEEHGVGALDFDPLGQSVQVRQGNAVFFSLESFQPF